MPKTFLYARGLFYLTIFLALPVCVSYQLPDPFVTPRVILISALFLVLIPVIFFKPLNGVAVFQNLPFLSLLVFMLLYAFAISKSLNPGDAWYEWMKSFLIIPVMLAVAALYRDEESRRIMLKFSQVSVLMLSAIYGYQWLYLYMHPNYDVVFDYRIHIASTLGNKNFYAELICMLLPFSALGFFTLKKFWKWLSLFNCILLLFSIFTTQSFAALGAMFTAACAVSLVFYTTRKGNASGSWKLAGYAGLTVLLFGLLLYKSGTVKSFSQRVESIQQYLMHPGLVDSTAKANSNSTFERIMLWRNSIGLINENPLSGCGANNWKLLYPKFGISGTSYIEGGNVHYEHPHNDYLLIASEAGLPAMLAFIIFLLSMAWLASKGMKKTPTERLWFSAVLFGVVCFLIVSAFSFPRMRLYSWLLLGIYMGLLSALQSAGDAIAKTPEKIWKPFLLLCAVLSAWTLTAAISRYSSELHSEQMQMAKKQKNFARLTREAERAASWYFPVDETATPIDWYKGMALFYSGNIAGAKAAYEDALEKNPYHIQLLNDLATACEQTGERERAVQYYRRALSVTPFFAQSLLNISACYFNLSKIDSAFIYIDKVYGIRLNFQEKKSYDVYLPAILREKIFKDTELFPTVIRPEVLSLANDTQQVNTFYRKAKSAGAPFPEIITESLSQRQP